ncbi:DUF397 domain-containing protein [Streptomyces sp. LP05-1]|uniref:DUF397 domain-containing protein n=1 Tax=Streptomyces pyxinae TaxID=2970734 RepID=A0ABT2CEM8_9ACTN|nr:DUF397 domain-containing protein [Streptomyces sp. LP05-1]MCS0635862.1 DUF397 domain-containing protein [Streptomyces sp. LP05-1]
MDTFLRWVKSSYSGPAGGNCVEWAPGAVGGVLVRDSKVTGPIVTVSTDVWATFVGAVRSES